MAVAKCGECGCEINKKVTVCPDCGSNNLKLGKGGCFVLIIASVLVGVFLVYINSNDTLSSIPLKGEKTAYSQKNKTNRASAEAKAPKTGIGFLTSKYERFTFTAFDSTDKILSEPFPKKYHLVANAGWMVFDSCIESKVALKNIMEDIYRHDKLTPLPERVLININHNLRASLGKNDAINLPWDDAGPSLFLEVFLKHRPYEYEKGALHSRTWGEIINSECI